MSFLYFFPSNYGVALSGSVPFIFLFNLNFRGQKGSEKKSHKDMFVITPGQSFWLRYFFQYIDLL